MEVRYNQDTDAGMVLKNGLKEGKDGKESQGSLSKTFLKEQQESFSPSGPVENCEKNRGSSVDPDYCRRILVRGKGISNISCVFRYAHSLIKLLLYYRRLCYVCMKCDVR